MDSLACHALDWGLVVGCSGGAVAVIILAVMAAAVAKCCRSYSALIGQSTSILICDWSAVSILICDWCRERRLQTKYLQCDYLQYTCSPNMEPAAKEHFDINICSHHRYSHLLASSAR